MEKVKKKIKLQLLVCDGLEGAFQNTVIENNVNNSLFRHLFGNFYNRLEEKKEKLKNSSYNMLGEKHIQTSSLVLVFPKERTSCEIPKGLMTNALPYSVSEHASRESLRTRAPAEGRLLLGLRRPRPSPARWLDYTKEKKGTARSLPHKYRDLIDFSFPIFRLKLLLLLPIQSSCEI